MFRFINVHHPSRVMYLMTLDWTQRYAPGNRKWTNESLITLLHQSMVVQTWCISRISSIWCSIMWTEGLHAKQTWNTSNNHSKTITHSSKCHYMPHTNKSWCLGTIHYFNVRLLCSWHDMWSLGSVVSPLPIEQEFLG